MWCVNHHPHRGVAQELAIAVFLHAGSSTYAS
jgi:hypothetical protein